jgi:hypothetical protein
MGSSDDLSELRSEILGDTSTTDLGSGDEETTSSTTSTRSSRKKR